MLKNYFKIAWRNLWKHKLFSCINILGLAIGLTACFLILLYVSFELSYDSFHTTASRTYRLVVDSKSPLNTSRYYFTSGPMAPSIKNDFSDVESFVRIMYANQGDFLVRRGELKFQEKNALYADSTFFQVFDFRLLKGDANTALKAPYSIVLSQRTAKKYFGDEDPIGKSLMLPGYDTVAMATVTGIMENIPENSQIKADVVLSMSTITRILYPRLDEQWGGLGVISYLLLKPGVSDEALEAKLPAFLERRIGAEMAKNQMFYTLFLEPLEEVYLHSRYGGPVTGSISNVYIFSITAIVILLIACFNFVNLTTARAAERAKEVGVRKAVGAVKKHLALQFVGESVLLCLIAFVLAVLFSALLAPVFNELAGKAIANNLISKGPYILVLFLATICVGLLAGTYPAWMLSSLKPLTVLRGRFTASAKGILLRKGLVVSQFAFSLVLIIGTILVYRQLNYVRSQDLGFKKDQMMIINSYMDSDQEAFKRAVNNISGVKSTALSANVPGKECPRAHSEIENSRGDMQRATVNLYFADFDFIDQYDIKMAAGRPFSRDFGTDSTQAMIVNNATVKMLGYTTPEDALGKRFKQRGLEGRIIGVVEDFHYKSLQEEVQPLTMVLGPDRWFLISVEIAVANLPTTVTAIEREWNRIVPGKPFTYNFLDESFDNQYSREERFGKLFFYFAVLAVFISCLGLLGLASYSTRQRIKEIGIRKTLGASVINVVTMLSKDFIKLVGIAFLIATPVAWYAMSRWLEGFAYRIQIAWWVFFLAGLLALAIALLTISFQAIKAALLNPVKSLRSE